MKTYKRERDWTDLDHLQFLVGCWGDRTFPSHKQSGVRGPVYHLREEVEELIERFEVGEDISAEAADCGILLLMVAHLADFSLDDAIQEKHRINENRTWGPPDENGICHHRHEEE